MRRKQLNFLMPGTGAFDADKSPFLAALADAMPGTSVFMKKKAMGTLDKNGASAQRQLRAAIKKHQPKRVVLVGHSEGGIHAMKLAGRSDVDLAVICATPVCTFQEAMIYQHECRPPVPAKIRKILNSEPWAKPSKKPGPRDRKAILDWLTEVGWPTTDEFVDYNTSLLRFSGAELLTAAPREKLLFVYAKHDMNVPKDISLKSIAAIDPGVRVMNVPAHDHEFRTRKKKHVSQATLHQIVAATS